MKAKRTKLEKIHVKSGNTSVTIYQRRRTKGDARYTEYTVVDYSGGKRKLLSFAVESDARSKAKDIADKLTNGDVAALRLSSAEVAAAIRARDLLEPTGVAIELAAAEYADAHQKLGGRSLAAAVDFFVRHHPVDLPDKSVSAVFDEMLKAKRDEGLSPRYLQDLEWRLGKFAADFSMPISAVTGAQIRQWLQAKDISNRSRNNFRIGIQTLFQFAVAQKYLPKNWDEMDSVPTWKAAKGTVHIFTPEQISTLLSVAPENMIPFLAIGAFAGLRSAEIERLDWADVDRAKGYIVVDAHKSKTAQRRLVPILPNLAAWMAIYGKKRGAVVEVENVPNAIQRLVMKTAGPDGKPGVEWKHNALRHSFCSYRLAEVKSAAQVSLEAGNSVRMVFAHYRELVTESDARMWFGIMPGTPANVIAV